MPGPLRARLAVDGSTTHYVAFTAPLIPDEGEATHVIHMSLDVTAVHRLESQLTQASAMRRALIENSLDACRADRDKEQHFVRVEVRREPPYMVFDVEDNGIGMDRETREKIFSLFFTSKGIKGTGLGLFIANKIVDKHGGRIEVDSEPQRGTRFLIRFPLKARPSVPPVEKQCAQEQAGVGD